MDISPSNRLPSGSIEILPVPGLPEVTEGTSVGRLIAEACEPEPGDVVVVSQKVVSKAEDRVRDLEAIHPGEEALALAERVDKDPALVELILSESRSIIRAEPGVLITETESGWICANGGVDASNVPGERSVALLPLDSDESARRIRREIHAAAGTAPAVIVSDSFGRPWRLGQSEVAIGCAGLLPLDDWRGRPDRDGRELAATMIALADEVAAAADLVRTKDTGIPVALVRGLGHHVSKADGPGAAALRRPADEDLFR